jgi:hypothetical protein
MLSRPLPLRPLRHCNSTLIAHAHLRHHPTSMRQHRRASPSIHHHRRHDDGTVARPRHWHRQHSLPHQLCSRRPARSRRHGQLVRLARRLRPVADAAANRCCSSTRDAGHRTAKGSQGRSSHSQPDLLARPALGTLDARRRDRRRRPGAVQQQLGTHSCTAHSRGTRHAVLW